MSIMENYEDYLLPDNLDDLETETPVEDPIKDFENEEPIEETPKQETPDYLTRLLATKGLDKSSIKIQNENNELEEYDFDELSDDEKFAILSEKEELPISDEEINTLNFLRQNEMNMQQYTELIKQQAIEEYLKQSNLPTYKVDELNDDQLFAWDLIQRFGDDLTNEEIDAELEKAKENEELFAKKVNLIRQREKEREDLEKQQDEQQLTAQKQEFENAIINSGYQIEEPAPGISIEEQDRQQVLNFLLTKDASNQTGFSKALADPNALFKMGWYLMYGDQAFEQIIDHFKKEISNSRKPTQSQPKIVRKAQRKNSSTDPYGLDD